MSLSSDELIRILSEHEKETGKDALDLIGLYSETDVVVPLDIEGLPEVRWVDSQHEDGQMFTMLFSVGDQLFGTTYQYSSWSEVYFNTYTIKEYEKYQKNVVAYRTVK